MSATFGFDDFNVVWILVLLDLACAARRFFGCYWSSGTTASLWIQDVNDVAEAATVSGQQIAELGLKLEFFLELGATLQCVKLYKLSSELLLQLPDSAKRGMCKPQISDEKQAYIVNHLKAI